MNINSAIESPTHNFINFSYPRYPPDYAIPPPQKFRGHSQFSSNVYSNIDRENFNLMELDRKHEAHQNHFRNYINESIRDLNEEQIRKSLGKNINKNNSFAIGDSQKIKQSLNFPFANKDEGRKLKYESLIKPYERKRTVSLYNSNKCIKNNDQSNNSPKFLTETKQRIYPLKNQFNDIPHSYGKNEFEQKIIPYETIFKPKNSNANVLNFNERRNQFNIDELKKQAINNEPYLSKLHNIKKKTFSSDYSNDFNLFNNPYLSDLKWRKPINNENFFPFNTSNHSNVKKKNNFHENEGFYSKPSSNKKAENYGVRDSNMINFNPNFINNFSDFNCRTQNSNIFEQNKTFGNSVDLNQNIFFPGEDQPLFYTNKQQQIEKTLDKSNFPLLIQDFLILIDYDREIEKFKGEIKKSKINLSFFYQIMKKNANSIVDKGDFSILIKYFCPNADDSDIFLLMKRFSKSESLNLKFYDIVDLFCISSPEYNETFAQYISRPLHKKISDYLNLLMNREREHKKFRISIGHNENTLQIFKEIDRNKKGYLSIEDLRIFLHGYEIYANQFELAAIMKIFNKSNSGRINYNEFLNEINL